jgi:hypothetical protein
MASDPELDVRWSGGPGRTHPPLNSVHFPVAALAAMSLDAVITTDNPINTAAIRVRQVTDACLVLAFTTRDLLPKLPRKPPCHPPRGHPHPCPLYWRTRLAMAAVPPASPWVLSWWASGRWSTRR